MADTAAESVGSVYQPKLKSNLREKFKRINEGISQHGSSALLNEIYTELYITEGWSGDVNNEHEKTSPIQSAEAVCRSSSYLSTRDGAFRPSPAGHWPPPAFNSAHLAHRELVAALHALQGISAALNPTPPVSSPATSYAVFSAANPRLAFPDKFNGDLQELPDAVLALCHATD
ncbi:hypothetical protein Q7C36_011165 [Tachysurus vachellii]|uniref:FISNA domain-containing protein n=1 Tax=Tachysurus vachellii TaxID=175792 RepID=A0AA88MT98_TACVA|nr:hypothetical protein Q7C36_011165 [Tachysurus vachellii]